jgi:U32 family peptidase
MSRSAASSSISPAIRPAKPELLAPAGDWDCARAAIENGADAIYFGLEAGFNARARATNFSLADLPKLMELLHRRGVKGYVTLNTLAFPSELPALEEHVRALAAAGVDAVLIQDLGVARLVRQICPDLEIHASTQMTLSSSECIAAARELGIRRVVLPRELSLDEIKLIRQQSEMPLEVFVHGALCVAYSGQCLTSESLGGRSANRGQCAQACRMPYELLCDGELSDLGDVRYLLSPQDLAAFDLLPELVELGVASFKIEGRLKTPEYVANITRHYREALDAVLAGQPVTFSPQQIEEMELSFSRGFSHGWMDGCDHKMLVPGTSSAKRGVLLGMVEGVVRDHVIVQLATSIKRGDGVVLEGDRVAGTEQGGRVYEVFRGHHSFTEPVSTGVVDLTFQHGSIDFTRVFAGQKIWKTDDPELTARLRKTFTGEDATRRVPIDFTVKAAVGKPLLVRGQAANGAVCQGSTPDPLEAAMKHPLSEETLRKQLGRLGSTVYELRDIDAQIEGTPMVPLSVLGQLRHQLIEQLEASLAAPPARQVQAEPVLPKLRAGLMDTDTSGLQQAYAGGKTVLYVLCRTMNQLRAALQNNVRNVYVDFQDIREYGDAVEVAKNAGAKIYLATPRIQKPEEANIFRVLLKHKADGILARNLAGLAFYREAGVPVVADFSLNTANELTAQWLHEAGAQRITPAYDLNRDQLLELVKAVPRPWLEIVIHQHMPMFHMEHCVFCAVLSPGTNKTNCGRPCDVHQVKLRDRIGMEHTLVADVGCRNTLFNAVPQSAAEAVPELLRQGLRHFRIELLNDDDCDPAEVIRLYREVLDGTISGSEVWQKLRATNRVGVTRGTLEERRNPLAIL